MLTEDLSWLKCIAAFTAAGKRSEMKGKERQEQGAMVSGSHQ